MRKRIDHESNWVSYTSITSRIITSSNTIVNLIPVGANPRAISFSADGSRAYVANFGGNAVDVLDVSTQRNLGTPIQVGASSWGIATAPDGQAYVANFGDGTISVIDTAPVE